MKCGVCQKILPPWRYKDANGKWQWEYYFPESQYWIGTPRKVVIPLCSPECSLVHYEKGKENGN